jgi:DNA-binding beta-propeller fold protein YncE
LGVSDQAAALREISGPDSELNQPVAVAAVGSRGEVFVANRGDSSITVYSVTGDPSADSVVPVRRIAGPLTALSGPSGIAVDKERGEILVANSGGTAVTAYAIDADGDVAPTQTLTLPTNAKGAPLAVAVRKLNQGRFEVYVATSTEVHVFESVGTGTVYQLTDRVIAASAPGLKRIGGIAVNLPSN